MKPSEYHAVGNSADLRKQWLSKSLLWKFGQSPFLWKHGPPFKKTDAMRWGSLVDCLVTTPELFEEEFAILPFPDYKKQAARDWRDAEKREVVTCEEYEDAMKACKMMLEHLGRHVIGKTLSQAHKFAVIDHEGTCYNVKALADILTDDAVHDIKTTQSIDERAIRNTIAGLGYHVQGALYCDLFGRDKFVLHFQESTAPYRTRRVDLTVADLEEGRRWYMRAIALWHECVTTDTWPGSELEPLTGGLPSWYGRE